MPRGISAVFVVLPFVLFLRPPAGAALQAPTAELLGPWTGAIQILGSELKIAVTFTEDTGALAATIDIPQQGATGLKLVNVRREGPAVHFELQAGPGLAVFDGRLDAGMIKGDFTQAGVKGTFALARGSPDSAKPAAPKAEPVPYREEEVRFTNGDITLAGTLTLPQGEGPFPAVVLLTGSGAQNRDEELLGFKPFRVIADHLTRRGVAVLRYDDRGVGGSSGATSEGTTDDFAGDAMAAVALLSKRSDVQPRHVGLLGHSEGALVAALAASRSSNIAFIVMLAGTAAPGEQIIRGQAEAIARVQGATADDLAKLRLQQDLLFQAVRTGQGWEAVIESARAVGRDQIKALPEEQRKAIPDPDKAIDAAIQQQLLAAKSKWYGFFIDYDPAQALSKVTCPVLALFGSLDLQVLAEMNRRALETALKKAGNRDVTVKVYDGANHLFVKAVTGSPTEYPTLEKTFVPGLLDEIGEWILTRTR